MFRAMRTLSARAADPAGNIVDQKPVRWKLQGVMHV
jgi:hypothetical protein